MRSIETLYKLIYEIIALIVLIILVYFFIETIIGISTQKDNQYKQYTSEIANVIKNGGQVNIINYDPEYVPTIVIDSQNNIWVYMYKCPLSENQPISPIATWAISSIPLKVPNPPPDGPNSIDAYIFSPDLTFCSLLSKAKVGPLNQYQLEINIKNMGGEVGYLIVIPNIPGITPPQNVIPYYDFQTSIYIQDPAYKEVHSGKIYLYKPSLISINKVGAEIDYKNAICYLSKLDKNISSCIEFPTFFMPPVNKVNQYIQPVGAFYYSSVGQYALEDTVEGIPIIYYRLETQYVIMRNIDLVFSNQDGQITLTYLIR
ncbi:MAG: hypothetical protein ACP5G1_04000 [Nanopusillaceae archaeon]